MALERTSVTPMKIAERSGLLVAILFLISMNLRPAITSLSPLLDTIQQHLAMNGVEISLLTSIPVLCMGIFAPVAALTGARWGVERTLTGCLILIGAAIALRAVTLSPWSLLATAFFSGIGMAVSGPLVSAFIKRYFPARAAAMVGVYTAGMSIGSSISAGLAIPVEHWLSGSWNGALAIWSVFTVIALVFWLPTVHRSAPKVEAGLAPVRVGGLPWKNPRVWLLMFIFGLQSGLYYSVATWLAPLAHEAGSSLGIAGAVLTACSVVQLASNLLIPMAVHRTGKPERWLLGGAILLLVGFVMITLLSGILTPWPGAIVIGFGLGGLFPLAVLLPLNETDTPQEANEWTSAMMFGGYILSSLIPMLVGEIKDALGSYHDAFIALMFLTILLAVAILFVRPRKS